MKKHLVTVGAVHTHTHTDSFLANGFCFLACNFLVAGVDFCAQNLIEFIGELAFWLYQEAGFFACFLQLVLEQSLIR